MPWYLIVVLTVVGLLGLLVLLASFIPDPAEAERVRVEMEVRRAERRLHDIARDSFQAMLEEARTHSRGRVR